MKLKDHPLLKNRDVSNWPPSYLTLDPRRELIKEFGILRAVTLDARAPNRCFLMVEMGGLGYVSRLKFDSFACRERFVKIINVHLNKPMKEIGELEVFD